MVVLRILNFRPNGIIVRWGAILSIYFLLIATAAAEDYKQPDRLGPKDFDYAIINAFLNSGGKGILTAFKGDPEMHGNNLQLSYYLKEGHEFKGEFMIGNYTDDPINYYVICLVDYNKQVFLFNGEKGDVHSVSLKSKERVIYPMAIGGLKKGAHDLLLVAIKKTSDDFDKVDFPILSYRANLFIESYSFPPVPYVKIDQKRSDSKTSQIAIVSGGKAKKIGFANESALPISVQFNNANSENMNYAVLIFSDMEQKSLNVPIIKSPLFFQLSSHMQGVATIESTVHGKGNMWVIQIENPYVRLETENNEMAPIPARLRISNSLPVMN